MSQLTFNAVFEDSGDGWVYAYVPELPVARTPSMARDDPTLLDPLGLAGGAARFLAAVSDRGR